MSTSFLFDELLLSFIFPSHQHVQLISSQILLIFIDFSGTYSSLNLHNSGTKRDIKKQ